MATPPQLEMTVRFVREVDEETLDSGAIDCTILTSPDRSIGISSGGGGGAGDVIVSITRAQYLALGDEEDASYIGLPIVGAVRATIAFGLSTDDPVILGGYWVRAVTPQDYGVPQEDLEAPARFNRYELTLSSVTTRWEDGRGGYLWEDTINAIGPDGLPPPDGDPDRFENSDLVAVLGTYTPLPLVDPLPDTLDDFEPPAPLDWGAGRALPELEAVLSRIGHAAALTNSGAEIEILRLARAGEDLAIPDPLPSGFVAEPYELAQASGVRASKVLVTSGRTRTTILTTRDLGAECEWVWFDERTGLWLNDSETLALYPSETQPGDIDALNAGPGAGGRPVEEFSRLFRAARLIDASGVGSLVAVNLPSELPIPGSMDTVSLGASPAAAYGDFAEPRAAGQFAQRTAAALRGVRVDAAARVFVFPFPLAALPGGGPSGSLGDLVEVASGDVTLLFAHERAVAATDPRDNYFMRLYTAVIVDGEITITPGDDADVLLALLDPETVILDAPFIRFVGTDRPPAGEPGPITWLNLGECLVVAASLARARLAGEAATSGVIPLKGLLPTPAPGMWGGCVSRVQWDIPRMTTYLFINQHEIPLAAFDAAESYAGRSFAAGLSRFTLPGSSAAMSDVRGGSAPSSGGVASGGGGGGGGASGGGGSLDAATTANARGASKTVAAPGLAGAPSPTARDGDPSEFLARITGATLTSAGRWKYEFVEVYINDVGSFVDSAAGRASTMTAFARNLAEGMNTGMGLEGNGVNRDNLPAGFEMQPIPTGRHVLMRGPFPGASGGAWFVFSAENADDGSCV